MSIGIELMVDCRDCVRSAGQQNGMTAAFALIPEADLMHQSWLAGLLTLMTRSVALAPQDVPQPLLTGQMQIEHVSVWHGEKVNDPYFWLREKSNPEVIRYLEAENAFTEAATKDLQPFAGSLYQEMLGHIKQTDVDVPVQRGNYYYYSRTEEGKQYPIRCRKKVGCSTAPSAARATK